MRTYIGFGQNERTLQNRLGVQGQAFFRPVGLDVVLFHGGSNIYSYVGRMAAFVSLERRVTPRRTSVELMLGCVGEALA